MNSGGKKKKRGGRQAPNAASGNNARPPSRAVQPLEAPAAPPPPPSPRTPVKPPIMTGTLTIENSKLKSTPSLNGGALSARGNSYAAVLKPGLIEMTPQIKSMIFEDPIPTPPLPPPLGSRPAIHIQSREPGPSPNTHHASKLPVPSERSTFSAVPAQNSAPESTVESLDAVPDEPEPEEYVPPPPPVKDSFVPGFLVSQLDSHRSPLEPLKTAVEVTVEDPDAVMETGDDALPVEMEFHLLETAWTLYHMNAGTRKKGSDWNAGILPVGVFDTVEAFFHGFNSMPRPSETARQQDYMFFRGGKGPNTDTPVILAAWEDSKNAKGGMWRYSFPMRSKQAAQVDFYWKEILMALIGEQFGLYNDSVNGCYFCNRGDEYRLQVWMGHNDVATVTAVGVRLAEIMNLRDIYFDYCSHKEIHDKGNRGALPLVDHKEIFSRLERPQMAA
ncbi:uncharacterized protein LOC129589451 [Paramacrobiotus metropolitanus]|uniref:uncharacterized protein LOC129589451 n=1 Tax=Paramacrobiotus metropolitanus TaxID=2943436 RepID=UPI0024460FD2|nr:uncharacterized protein LOC129589451 [Paramacrobiotus metropolitanus]